MILRNSKPGLGAKNMFYAEKKIHITPIPPHNGDLSTTAIFFLSPKWPLWRGSTVLLFRQVGTGTGTVLYI